MSVNNLISIERAKINLPSAQSTDENTIDVLIGSCSAAIQKYCRRWFHPRFYDELYNGNGDRRLLLRQYPLQSVQSVRYRPVVVAKVINNAMSTYQQARVAVSATGLVLTTMASGVAATITSGLDWVTCPTLSSLMTAVSALGNGWVGQVVGDAGALAGQVGDYGLWPSADLYVPNSFGDPFEGGGILQSGGAMNARGINAELRTDTYELQGYQWDARGWLLRAIPYTDPELLHPEDLIWPVGINNFRIQYTAGYSIIPEDVQEACAQWVAERWYLTQRDPTLTAQSVSGTVSQRWEMADTNLRPPREVAVLLAPYRRYSMGTNQG